MTQPLSVRPHRFPMLGAAEGAQFCLVTHSHLLDLFVIDQSGDYSGYMKIAFDPDDDIDALLRRLPEPAHVLVILPDRLFESPTPDKVGRRKLGSHALRVHSHDSRHDRPGAGNVGTY